MLCGSHPRVCFNPANLLLLLGQAECIQNQTHATWACRAQGVRWAAWQPRANVLQASLSTSSDRTVRVHSEPDSCDLGVQSAGSSVCCVAATPRVCFKPANLLPLLGQAECIQKQTHATGACRAQVVRCAAWQPRTNMLQASLTTSSGRISRAHPEPDFCDLGLQSAGSSVGCVAATHERASSQPIYFF